MRVCVSERERERREREEREILIGIYNTIYRKPSLIPDDDFSKDIFGEDGLAEFNEVLRQLEDIQFSIDTGSFLNSL
jgi:hypothetical protein